MTEYAEVDLMAIGAHPDDVEVGCGGLRRVAH
jgi:LmbE family N-acetylglucosaminyl deacetylase